MCATPTMPSVFPVTSHTNFVGENSVFVAIKGQTEDGINYCMKAIEKGARTLVVHDEAELPSDVSAAVIQNSVAVKRVQNTRKALAELSAEHAGFPAKKMKIVGITGTKGKTTTSFLTEHVLRVAGYKTALISSVINKILDVSFPAIHATPQPDYLHQFLKLSVKSGVEYVVMEVAAQALSLYRVHGIEFDGIIFTNFSHEHLEFYSTLDDYFAAKHSIVKHAKQGAHVVVNADDERTKIILVELPGSIGYSLCHSSHAYHFAQHDTTILDRVAVVMDMKDKKERIECASLFGRYNAYNVVSAVTLLCHLGIDAEIIRTSLLLFSGVPGRLERYNLSNGAHFFIDYAHNPDSFNAVLSTFRPLTDMLIVIFGAGGGRDRYKRPAMGRIASEYADVVIITSDNPRLENPFEIANDIISGIPHDTKSVIICELDRKKAIEYAYGLSYSGAIVAILGKGHSEYQLFGTEKNFFSEKEIIGQLR